MLLIILAPVNLTALPGSGSGSGSASLNIARAIEVMKRGCAFIRKR